MRKGVSAFTNGLESDELIRVLRERAGTFTAAEKKVATYLVRYGLKVAFTPSTVLAREVGVSEATMARFARKIGYESYASLQAAVRRETEQRLTMRPSERVARGSHRMSTGWNALERAVECDIGNIRQTLAVNSPEEFEKAVDLVLAARRVYVFGLRPAGYVAGFVAYCLNLLIDNACAVGIGSDDYWDAFIGAGPEDVVLAIGLSRQTRMASRVLAFARERGVRVIALTDHPRSTFGQLAEVKLFAACEGSSVLVSFSAAITLAQALVAAVASKRGPAALERLRQIERVFEDFVFEPLPLAGEPVGGPPGEAAGAQASEPGGEV